MKRKLLMFSLIFALVFSMAGCGNGDSDLKDDSQNVEESKDDKDDEKESEKVVKGTLVVPVPEGFTKVEEDGVISYSKENVSSNIVINKTVNDGSLKNVTADMMLSVLDPQLEATYGTELTLALVKEQKVEIDGHVGFMYAFSYSFMGFEIVQTQYILENGDTYEFVTFTDITSEGYTATLADCEKNISFE